jgi:hypothetical protein
MMETSGWDPASRWCHKLGGCLLVLAVTGWCFLRSICIVCGSESYFRLFALQVLVCLLEVRYPLGHCGSYLAFLLCSIIKLIHTRV